MKYVLALLLCVPFIGCTGSAPASTTAEQHIDDAQISRLYLELSKVFYARHNYDKARQCAREAVLYDRDNEEARNLVIRLSRD